MRRRPVGAVKGIGSDPTEAQFVDMIVELAQTCGWLINHQRPAMVHTAADGKPRYVTATQGNVGFPDLVMVHSFTGRLVFRECKTLKGRVSPEQRAWIDALRAGGHDAAIWRTDQWLTEVVPLLTGERNLAIERSKRA